MLSFWYDCGVDRGTCTPQPECRVAVREIESWVMADRVEFSRWLRVPVANVSESPDSLADPKESLINLARKSNRGGVRDGIVPPPGRPIGPDYNGLLCGFVQRDWRPESARLTSPSLDRAMHRMAEFRPSWGGPPDESD